MRDTAVQWYHNQIGFLFQQWHNHQITISEFHDKRLELEQQAKEIEHNQMMQCYSDGLGNGMAVGEGECSYESVADEKEYVIKKYGSNK